MIPGRFRPVPCAPAILTQIDRRQLSRFKRYNKYGDNTSSALLKHYFLLLHVYLDTPIARFVSILTLGLESITISTARSEIGTPDDRRLDRQYSIDQQTRQKVERLVQLDNV